MSKVTNIKTKRAKGQVFDMTSQQCIWSAAGVTDFRLCTNAFDCPSCAFDMAMQKRARDEGGGQMWHKGEHDDPLEAKRCRHMLSGYVPVKYCSHNFHCSDCEFDQLVEAEMLALEPEEPPVEMVAGFALARRHYYLRGHTWARLEYGGQVRVGVDDFGARLLGPPDTWSLPSLGSAITQGEPGAVLSRLGHRAELLNPVKGIVVAVNHRLRAEPGLANTSPYGPGWLMIVQPVRPGLAFTGLLFGNQAGAWMEQEAERLNSIIHRDTTMRLAAAGGRALPDIWGGVDGLDWDELVQAFLTHNG